MTASQAPLFVDSIACKQPKYSSMTTSLYVAVGTLYALEQLRKWNNIGYIDDINNNNDISNATSAVTGFNVDGSLTAAAGAGDSNMNVTRQVTCCSWKCHWFLSLINVCTDQYT